MTDNQIKELALRCGFKLKEQPDGNMDLNPYVYEFARALIKQATIDVRKNIADVLMGALNSQPSFKIGDIVVCGEVDNFALTEGKCYKVLDVDGSQIEIQDDLGDRWFFSDDEVVFTLYEED